MQPEKRLQPNESHLAGGGDLNLVARYGPLDLLGTIGPGLGFTDLLPHSIEMEVATWVSVRILDLEMIIAVKEHLGSEKDLAVLPILRRTLSEIKKKRS